MSDPIRKRTELLKAATEYQSGVKAADASDSVTTSDQAVPETDPAEKGKVNAPNHPDGDVASKLLIPEGARPTNTSEADTGFVTQNPGPSGTDPMSTADGDAQDARFTEPTTSLDKCSSEELAKIAAEATPIFERMKNYSATLGGNLGADATKAAGQVADPTTPAAATAPDEQPEAVGDLHVKIASALLSTEKGVQLVEGYLSELRGVQDAQQMIAKAACDQAEFQKMAAHVQDMIAHQEAMFDEQVTQVSQLYKSASEEDQERLVKLSQAHAKELAKLPPELHSFYKAGAADAAMVVQAMMAGGEPGIPGGEGDLGPEQLLGLIQQLVQSGELDPQTAEMLAQQLLGGGGGEEMPPEAGGMPPEAGGGELPPEAGGAPPEEMPKAASLADQLIAEAV